MNAVANAATMPEIGGEYFEESLCSEQALLLFLQEMPGPFPDPLNYEEMHRISRLINIMKITKLHDELIEAWRRLIRINTGRNNPDLFLVVDHIKREKERQKREGRRPHS